MLVWKCLRTIRILTFKHFTILIWVTAVLMFRKFQRIVKYFSTNVTNFFIFLLVSLLFRTSLEFLFRLIFALPLELNLFNTTGNRNIIDLLQWSWSWLGYCAGIAGVDNWISLGNLGRFFNTIVWHNYHILFIFFCNVM